MSPETLLLVAVAALPLVAAATCLIPARRVGELASVIAGLAVCGITLALVPYGVGHPRPAGGAFMAVDPLSSVFLLAVGLLYALSAMYSVGYLKAAAHGRGGDGQRGQDRQQRQDGQDGQDRQHGHGGGRPAARRRLLGSYAQRYYAGLNVFAWAMLVAVTVSDIALIWVAIEVTTVVSALLVAIDGTDAAAEAAWKYVLIASMGLGLSLLATILEYYAGTASLGPSYSPLLPVLLAHAHAFPKGVVRLAFLLAVVGFGTKMGLVPVHTWLPDAHSEAPTPVSAMLSGSLLAVSFYAILRYFQITELALGPSFPRRVLLVFGLASLVLAASYLLTQHNLKRLFAYSSVEHMGLLAIGASFSARLALVGVMLHVIAHAAAKAGAFFSAGSLVVKYKSKEMSQMRGALGLLPVSGGALVLSMLALSAMPPFGIFKSELYIVVGGMGSGGGAAVIGLVVLVTTAFLGLSWHVTQVVLAPATPGPAPPAGLGGGQPARGEVSIWMVVPTLVALGVLVLLGIHLPAELSQVLRAAAAEIARPA
ncbi:MAG: proton-conducting transporter transmembrane domain-containing protein [Acidimicrobiales bacterium]